MVQMGKEMARLSALLSTPSHANGRTVPRRHLLSPPLAPAAATPSPRRFLNFTADS